MKPFSLPSAGLALGLCLGASLINGCTDTNKNGQPDTVASGNQINKSLDNAGEKIQNAANKMKPALQDAGKKMEKAADKAKPALEDAAKNAANAAEAGVTTSKVKLALENEPGLRGSEINVDTLAAKDTVALRGSVLTPAQKSLAEQVTKTKAPGYKIVDQLTIHKVK